MKSPHSMRGPSPEASGHTPGPWAVYHNGKCIGDETGHIASTDVEGTTPEEAEANARLIAAAPEMLAALRALLATSDLNFDSLEPDTVRAIQAARAVIAKVNS